MVHVQNSARCLALPMLYFYFFPPQKHLGFIFTELFTSPSKNPRPGVGWWEEKSGHVSPMFQPPHQASLRRKLQELRRKVPQCLLQLPQAALRARAKSWLGATFSFMPISVFPDVSGSNPWSSYSGSVSLDLLSCGFSFLCFSPAGYRSFRDQKKKKTTTTTTSCSSPSKLPAHSPFLRRSLAMFWPDSWISYKMFLFQQQCEMPFVFCSWISLVPSCTCRKPWEMAAEWPKLSPERLCHMALK